MAPCAQIFLDIAGDHTGMDRGAIPRSKLLWLKFWCHARVAAVRRQAAAHPVCIPSMPSRSHIISCQPKQEESFEALNMLLEYERSVLRCTVLAEQRKPIHIYARSEFLEQ